MKQFITIIVILLMTMMMAPSVWAESISLTRSNSDYLSISDSAQNGLDLNGDFTVEDWININQLPSTPDDNMYIISKAAQNDDAYMIFLAKNDRIYLDVENVTQNRTRAYSINPILDNNDVGEWVHIAVVCELTSHTITIYKNGNPISVTYTDVDVTSNINNNSQDVLIGARYYTSIYDFFDGKIDDLRVWDHARTQQQILNSMNGEINPDTPGLIAYWKFNGNLLDATSNNNDLTNHGASFSVDVPFDSSPEPDPDPEPEPGSCTITGNPINTNNAENLEGAGTNQLLTLGVNSDGAPVVCVSNVSDGSHLKTCEYGLDNTNTATSVFYISTTNEITITYYQANGDEYLLKYDYDTDTLSTPVELP